jgi:predicted GH43/DUF377 family glycosyl hydrolase
MTDHPWESFAAFNWCPIQDKEKIHCVYRAMSEKSLVAKHDLNMSSIGYADSKDGIDFKNRRQLIAPEEDWEKFGCEDPRVTKIDDTYYIFYTALSVYPFAADGIKVAVATTKDFKKIDERHLVTPFNAKAMVLFPEKINGKYVALLTAHTDMPPVKICMAEFDSIEQIWSKEYWDKWHADIDSHRLIVKRKESDQVEIGAVPIRTKSGWLVIYSHIQNYYSNNKIFGIEALLLDLNDPKKIIARTDSPILVPEETYEMFGQVQDIVFPSGSFISGHKLHIYYGATDTTCCRADVDLEDLLESIEKKPVVHRAESNPILMPNELNPWEDKAVFNPAAIELDGKIHLVYRAMGESRESVMGYASTKDGIKIDERLNQPIYVPREPFESAYNGGVPGFGCEDPRITQMGDSLYMFYTAYNGMDAPGVAATSIKTEDFLNKKWNWAKPAVISPSGVDDKDACLFPEKINSHYLVLHRAHNHICLDPVKSLNFEADKIESFTPIIGPRPGMWDGQKVGISAVPLKTDYGWLLFYHGVSAEGVYRVGAVLLSADNPDVVLSRTTGYIFSPEMPYEKTGQVSNVVFPCGVVERSGTLFIYYGAADQVIGVATTDLVKLLKILSYSME